MKNKFSERIKTLFHKKNSVSSQNGSAIVIAVLVMLLLLAFVALALSRTTSETISASNDTSESKTFSAAQASLEVMTRNFSKIFDEKLAPDKTDLDNKVIAAKPPGLESQYDFVQKITQTEKPKTVLLTSGLYQGLNASRDEWRIESIATEKATGVQVELHRQFFNNLIPIFQFGMFYDDDLEIHPGARFDFGGRVHSNANLFTMTSAGTYFNSKVSAVGQIVTEVARSGKPSAGKWGELTYVKNASFQNVQLGYANGSVTTNSALAEGSKFFDDPDMPVMYRNKNWKSGKESFGGNLLAEQPRLDLPLKIASQINGKALDYVELIKRGKNPGDAYQKEGSSSLTNVTAADEDTIVTKKGKYYNQNGLRVSLADSRQKLPGCAAATKECGIRLDGDTAGESAGSFSGARGYQPKQMKDGYQATRLNANRLMTSGTATGRQTWIKIELVRLDAASNTIVTEDVTEDILSLGVTEPPPFASLLEGYGSKDSRSILKMQRYTVPGVNPVTANDTNFLTQVDFGGTIGKQNVVLNQERTVSASLSFGTPVKRDTAAIDDDSVFHQRTITPLVAGNIQRFLVPFPIEMFDTREGLYNSSKAADYKIGTTDKYNIPMNGVMSMVDIDIRNLKAFLEGQWDTVMPTGTLYEKAKKATLTGADVPQSKGWVLYVSDRRGDYDFDGEYDMENVYTSNPDEATNSVDAFQRGEDVNSNGKLDVKYDDEAPRYTATTSASGGTYAWLPETASTIDHSYYRRGIRLINGQELPGKYDADDSTNTRGFTVASENGVYVLGNYNAYGVDSFGTPTRSDQYLPKGEKDVPASIAADAITILSANWSDANSFRFPFTTSKRTPAADVFLRFAILSGDTMSSKESTPNQGGSEPNLSGGVHNFKRFLESWGGYRVNYSGSLINLFYSHNNNGTYKPDGSAGVYGAPTRNWVFNSSFQDPTRLPPGTPYFQSIQLTGFQRVSD